MTYLLRFVACLFLCVSLNTFAALSIRDLDGDWSNGHEGVYDDVLDITWLADTNYAHTSGYDVDNGGGGIDAYGGMDWNSANTWTGDLVIGTHANWRLPSTFYDISASNWQNPVANVGELAEMHRNNFGCSNYQAANSSNCDDANNISLFSNFWAGHEYWYFEAEQANGWTGPRNFVFSFGGTTRALPRYMPMRVWPVHDGDIGASPVPLPAGIYLFLSGLVGLGLMRGRNG